MLPTMTFHLIQTRWTAVLLAAFVALTGSAAGASVSGLAPEIRTEDLESCVYYLAGDECGGRLTGSEGALRAAKFIDAAFERAGLSPVPGLDGYLQPFTFKSGVRKVPDGSLLELQGDEGDAGFEIGREFDPLTFSGNGEVEGELIFVGYGLVEPTDDGYDSYSNLDVKGKIVLTLRDLPEDVSAERRQELALYAGDRYKAKLAADRGAAGFILVIGPNSPSGGELIRFREADRTSPIAIPAATVTQAVADRLLAAERKTVAELQSTLDDGTINPHMAAPRGGPLRMKVELERLEDSCNNVLGYLPPSPGIEEVVLLGAHYDHLGTGEGLGSLAKQGEEGMIHNGADDNASGTAVVMELAAALAQSWNEEGDQPRRGLIFAAWSGEELGLVGSDRFAENPPVPLENIVAYFNFDMVGRLRENNLIVQAVGSSAAWPGLLERRNVPAGFDLSLQDDSYLPTDLTSFYTKEVPGLAFFTDLHDDYNRPTDDPATLNYEGMLRITRFAEQLIRDAGDPDQKIDYVRVQDTSAPRSSMGRRVYTGMVPDFGGGEREGMLISDVRPGGPAEKAGLEGGDLVVEFAGKKIASLQDYSDALRGAKIGQSLLIVVIRDDERLELTITPEAREQ
jgi:hypothetical protein